LSKRGYEVKIISSDKDLTQLITDGVSIFDPIKSKIIKTEEIVEKYGVLPSQMVFLQALTGDASDNVPGVSGIGPKTAAKLVNEFKTLEATYENIDSVQPLRIREKLISEKESAILSAKLVALNKNVELDRNIEDLKISYDRNRAADFLSSLGLDSLISRISGNIRIFA
jgi:DNA polymerase-1